MTVYGPSTGHYGRDAIRAAKKAAQTSSPNKNSSSSSSSSSSSKSSSSSSSNRSSSSRSSSSSKKSSGSSGSSNSVKVGSDGNAQSGLSMGTIVNTGGGDYKIVDKNTPGASYNPASGYYSVKVGSGSNSSSGSSGSSSSSGGSSSSGSSNKSGSSSSNVVTPSASKTTYTDPSGKSQTGYLINGTTYKDPYGSQRIDVGSIVDTAGGRYQLTKNGSVKLENGAVASGTPSAQSTKTTATITRNGQNIQGYIQDGKTYDAQGNRVRNGDIVTAGNGKKYLMTSSGGIDVTGYTPAEAYGKDSTGAYNLQDPVAKLINVNGVTYDLSNGLVYRNDANAGNVVRAQNGRFYNAATGEDVTNQVMLTQGEAPPIEEPEAAIQPIVDEMLNAINQVIATDPTLTWEQAVAMAAQQLSSQYAQSSEAAMQQIDKNALQSGFFGQLPTEALKRQAAGSLEVDKINAINQLAAQLVGQSEQSAQTKLTAAQQEQQNKINNMLSLLGIYQNERAYNDSQVNDEWEKAMREAGLTGSYNGQPTLDFLNYQRLNNQYSK